MSDQLSILWVFIAVAFAIAEIVLPSFGAIFGTLAALLVAGINLIPGITWHFQVVIFAFALLGSLLFLRPRLLAKMQKSAGVPSRTESLIGKSGIITVSLDPVSGMGRAMIEGDDWAVQGEAGLETNTKITVVAAHGIVLDIRKAE